MSCRKETLDPCNTIYHGYIVGFDQCAVGRGFVLATLVPVDTIETFNLPDSLYTFPADIYRMRSGDFVFPKEYQNKFPITFSYRLASEAEKQAGLCPDLMRVSHFVHTVKNQVIITCAHRGL